MASVEDTLDINLMTSYGPILIGNIFAMTLWGISTMQLYLYFISYSHGDSKLVKLAVSLLWLLNTADQILLLESLFPVLILHWGYVPGLAVFQKPYVHHSWVSGTEAVLVQAFFMYRIYKFGRGKWVLAPVILIPVSLYQIATGIVIVFWCAEDNSLVDHSEKKFVALQLSTRACSMFIDVTIAFSMCYLLLKKRQPEWTRSNQMIVRLIVLTINSGLWTAIVSFGVLALDAIQSNTLRWEVFDPPLSALYLNTLLANLNARQFVRGSNGIWTDASTDALRSKDVVLRRLRPEVPDSATADGSDIPIKAIRVDTTRTTETYRDGESSKVIFGSQDAIPTLNHDQAFVV